MAPRSIWNGSIAFAEVVIPVKLFSAVQLQRVRFNEVRVSDGSRIQHRRFGAESGREVPTERIRRAYELSSGQQVLLADEEIAGALDVGDKTITIDRFVPTGQIDPVYYERPYILGPQPGSERAYRVLHDALQRTGKSGIGRFVLRTREQLIAVAAHDGALRLQTMRFADELVAPSQLDVPALGAAPAAKEVAMAKRLISTLSLPWEPERHEDHYRDAVLEVIKRKAAGMELKTAAPARTRETPDLMAALQRSLDQSAPRKPGTRARKPREASAKTPPRPAAQARKR